jgi:hypothetical protein
MPMCYPVGSLRNVDIQYGYLRRGGRSRKSVETICEFVVLNVRDKMSLIKCKECGKEISSDATICPACGARLNKPAIVVHVIVWAALLSVLAWYFFGGGVEQHAAQDWGKIKMQVANEAVATYQMAKRGGNAKDMCVQAEEVSKAFLQAHDDAQYQKWTNIEKSDCKAAGISH